MPLTAIARGLAGSLRRLLLALSLAAGGCAASAVLAADEVEVSLDLYHFAGNLDEEGRNALLASPDWKVSASYAPLLKVPGVTASWSRCGFLSLPCLQADSEEVTLTGSTIQRQGTELRFKLPHYRGVRRFRLSTVTISLPLAGSRDESPLETYFFVAGKGDGGAQAAPVVLQANTFFLAGTLRMKGEYFRPRNYCPESGHCWKKADNGRYVFQSSHRYALYRIGMLFPDDKELPLLEPTPGDLRGMKIYRARMLTRVVDGRRIDFVDVSATANREDCSSDDLKYEILYVDGEVIDYTRSAPDPDPGQCRTHFVRMAWGNDGKPITFGYALTEWVNHGSSVTSFSWNAGCSEVVAGNYQDCNGAAPTAAREAEIKADAVRVRRWFVR